MAGLDLYVGVDGGGSSTALCIMGPDEKVLATGSGGPCSIDTVPAEVTRESILTAATEAFGQLGLPISTSVRAVVAGVGGVVSSSDKRNVCDIISSLPFVTPQTHVEAHNDMVIGEAGGNSGRDGMCLIMGTGCVVFGTVGGRQFKSGGWGWKEGDAGSSYYLGVQAIRATVRAYDGRLEGTAFTRAVFERLGLRDIADITTVLYQQDMGRGDIARLAPLVTEHAAAGDALAAGIAEECAEEVFQMLRAVYTRVAVDGRPVECALVGSLANLPGRIRDGIERRLAARGVPVRLHAPELPPEVGAALLGLRAAR